MCWEGFVGCMAPWQTFCWTLLCEWIRPVCVKNWLREEQRSANWTWSKDQFLRSACLILSIKPMRKALEIQLAWFCKHCKENSTSFFQPSKFPPVIFCPCNEEWHFKNYSKSDSFKCGQISFRTLVCEPPLHHLAERLHYEFCKVLFLSILPTAKETLYKEILISTKKRLKIYSKTHDMCIWL